MLRFAGYLVATAGGVTGTWAATSAFSNSVIGHATSALENAMAKASTSMDVHAPSALSGAGNLAGTSPSCSFMDASRHRRSRSCSHRTHSNHHSHRNSLDMTPTNSLSLTPVTTFQLSNIKGDTAPEVLAALIYSALLSASAMILIGWMRVVSDLPKPEPNVEWVLTEFADEIVDEEMLVIGELEEEGDWSVDESPRRPTVELVLPSLMPRPTTPPPAEGMNNSDLHLCPPSEQFLNRRQSLSLTGLISYIPNSFVDGSSHQQHQEQPESSELLPSPGKLRRSSSKTMLARRRSRRSTSKASLNDIRRYFLAEADLEVNEGDKAEQGYESESLMTPNRSFATLEEALSNSAPLPDLIANMYVP